MKIIAQHRALVAFAVAGLAVTAAQAQSGRSEAQWQWNPGEVVGEAIPPLPPPTTYPVQLVLDDDTSDGAFGVGGQTARQFLWFNRFSAAGGFHLDEVWVLFPSGANMAVGGAVQISIYEDPDNDPTNGANWLGSFAATIQAADDNTFSIYPVPGSPVIPAGSDLLVGVVPRFIVSGVTSPTLPAALDTTATQSRSWVAAWTADPPDPPVLVPLPDQTLSLVDAFVPGGGNFMIRAFGTEQAVTEIPSLGSFGLFALALALGVGGTLALRRRKAAALALLLLALTAPASAVTIDTFTTNHATISDPPGTATSVLGAGGDPIANRRGLFVDLLTGAGPTSVGVAGGALSFSVTATTPDSRGKAVVTWDGDSNPNVLDPIGLPAVDLTASGHSGFRIVVNSATAGTELELDVYTSTEHSSAARRLPLITAPTSIYIPFDEFRAAAGAGASFAEVGAIVLTIRGTEVTAAIDLIETSAPTVAATKVDTQIVDTDGDTRVDPGDRVRYTVTVTNTGNEALAVDLSDTVDPNTTLVASSVSSTPVAHNDQYGWFGNVTFSTDGSTAKPNLLANDQDADGDAVIVQAGTFPATSARGGALTLNSAALGSFTYNPVAGMSGVDSFNYTIIDGDGNTSTATAYITLNGVIWFVDDSNTTAPFLGTFADPYQFLSSVSTVGDPDLPGDTIFVYDDDGTPYPGGVVLEADQTLLGEGVGLILDGTTIVPAGNRPQITNAAGVGLDVSLNNTVRGLEVTATSSVGILGANFGTLTISNVDVTSTGGPALGLQSGTLDATFGTLSSTGTAGQNGLSLVTVAGSLTAATTTLNNPTTRGIYVTTSPGLVANFGNATITDSAIGSGANATAVLLLTNAGASITFANLAIVADGGGLAANTTGTLNLGGASSSIVATGGAAVDIGSTSLGSGATFATVSSTNSTAKGVNLDTITGTFTANGGTISNAATGCLDVNGGSGNITYGGTISCTASRVVEVTARTGGTVTVSGNLTATGSATGINVASNTGGTVNFSGTSKSLSTSTGAAVTLATNTGATINFTGGGLVITSTSGSGFNATGGATAITVQGSGNTIASTTGTPLNVANSTIGASGLTFLSIAANGAANGIVLNTTGSSGGLTVTGTGTTDGSGGTIQNTSNRGASFASASSISLSNMNFTNAGSSDLDADNSGLSTGDNLATNAAIHLQTVTGATLTNLNISGGAEQGINGNTVSNFVLSDSSIVDAGNGPDEDGIHFFNMSGTSSITNTTINCTVVAPNTTGGDDHLNLQMQSGTLNLTISGGSATNANKGSGYLFGIRGTSNATINLSSATSTTNFSGGIVADAFDSATMNLNVTNSTSTGNNDQLSLSAGDSSQVQLTATGNTLRSLATGDFVVISLLGSAFDTGYLLRANISANTISTANGLTADGIIIFNAGGGAIRAALTGNNIDYAGTQRAIIYQAGQDGNGAGDLTVTGNTIDVKLDGAGNAVTGILAQTAITGPGNTSSLCADIGGAGALSNTFTHSLGGGMAGGDIRVRQRNDGTVRLPGYAGGATDLAAVATYLNGRNAEVSGTTATADSGGFAGGAACLQP